MSKLRARRALTLLNLRLSARYDYCESNGGHRPSGDTVMRQFPAGLRNLPICKGCECPYGGPAHYYSSARGGKA